MTGKSEQFIQSLKAIEDALNQKDAQLREFLEIAPEGIVLFDLKEKVFTMCNSNALALLKFKPEELLGKRPGSLSPEFQPDGRRSDFIIAEYIDHVSKGERLIFEWLVKDGEGRTFMAEMRLVPLVTVDRPHVYVSFVDITERIQARSRIELQSKKLREIAFLQSHQVRGPVANILGITSLFDFKNLNNPLNAELLGKLEGCISEFDQVIREITLKTE